MTENKILQAKMVECELEDATIGEYLVNMLVSLWEEGETFSGKRPLGDSGWQYRVRESIRQSGLVAPECGESDIDELVIDAIYSLIED